MLTLAAIALLFFSYGQLRFEAFFEQRNLAEAFVDRVGKALSEQIERESKRAPAEYGFLLDDGERFNQLSPLSTLSPQTSVPGTLGYFQVDAAGQFSTPLLPSEPTTADAVGFSAGELAAREQQLQQLRSVLVKDRQPGAAKVAVAETLAPAASADRNESLDELADDEEAAAATGASGEADAEKDRSRRYDADISANQKIFAELSKSTRTYEENEYVSSVGRVDELKLKRSRNVDDQPARVPAALQSNAQVKKERRTADNARLIEDVVAATESITLNAEQRGSVFADSINQFRLTTLDGDYVALHRDVWLDGERRIQGFVVRLQDFVDQAVGRPFAADPAGASNDLVVALNDEVVSLVPATNREIATVQPTDVAGNEILLRRTLPAPAHDLELIVSTRALPSGAGRSVLAVTGTVLLLLIVAGYLLLTRLMHRSIDLAQQQQDFVSAVTHELKTPLTSIRMYGEILRAGWADEEKKRSYYDFIFHESERLSRLINNVLQLARISRGVEAPVSLESRSVNELVDNVRVASEGQFEGSGFALEVAVEESLIDEHVAVDPDGFLQVMVNLIDNALKFAGTGQPRTIVVGARPYRDCVDFFVRDYGPGIPQAKMKKIFELFYRGEDEATRETTGTGIGLALVAELVGKMGGQIDVINRAPGAEFIVRMNRADVP